MKKILLKTLCLTLLLSGIENIACASGEHVTRMQPFTLDEVIVTANKYAQKKIDAHADITVIKSDEIEKSHIDSLEKVLRRVPGTAFFNYAIPGYRLNKVLLNGSGVVLTLIDGIPVNMVGTPEGSHSGGYTGFLTMMQSMSDIDRIEVLKGAPGVQYGSGAVGGVINVITKRGGKSEGAIEVSGGSFSQKRLRLHYNFVGNNWEALIYRSRYLQGDVHAANEFSWRGYDASDNYGLKVHYIIGNRNEITLRYDRNKRIFDTYDFVYGQHLFNGLFSSKTWTFTWDFKISDSLTNRVSFLNQDYLHRTDMKDKYNRVYAPWFNDSYIVKNFSNQLIKKFDKHTLLIGTDIQYGKIRNVSYLSNAPKTARSWGIYLQDSWNVKSKWNMTAGIRHDRMDARNSAFKPNWTKSISIGYKFSDDKRIYSAYNEYMVLPSLLQMYSKPYGNPNLVPERGRNYQIGYNQIFKDGTSLNLSAFIRKSRNKVHYVGDLQSGQYSGIDIQTSGFNIGFSKTFGNYWNARIDYTYLRFPLKDNSLSSSASFYIPRNTINAYVEYNKDRWNVNLSARAFLGRCGPNPSITSPEKEVIPSSYYWIVNLGANYQLNNKTLLFLQVDNLFNQLYAERTNAIWNFPGTKNIPNRERIYYMPGRRILLGAKFSI